MTSKARQFLFAILIGGSAAGAFAGNYAEGDPRPAGFNSELSRSAVSSEAKNWAATAPTVGYPEGNPRASVTVSQRTRAEVQAEAVAWVQSGMAQLTAREGISRNHPAMIEAMSKYNDLIKGQPKAEASSATRVE